MTDATDAPQTAADETAAAFRAPVFTQADPAQVRAALAFFDTLRPDNQAVARQETERLAAYFDTYAQQSLQDLDGMRGRKARRARKTLTEENGFTALFNKVARRTRNTILSEIVIAPTSLLAAADVDKAARRFGNPSRHEAGSFVFGFWQVANEENGNSVSVPFFAFDDLMMNRVNAFRPEGLYRAFQQVMSTGNHDMLHHYTNTLLNPKIAAVSRTGGFELFYWRQENFPGRYNRDSDIGGYESWLVLNHARLFRDMEQGPAGDALKASVGRFFDELERLGKDVAKTTGPNAAHETVDYFGNMLCFALMRYVPMTHPLMQSAIRRLQEADPDAAALSARAPALLKQAEENYFVEEALANYRVAGTDFLKTPDYAALKTIEIMALAPTIAHLMSPGPEGSRLAEMQERAGRVNADMLKATVSDMKHHTLFSHRF